MTDDSGFISLLRTQWLLVSPTVNFPSVGLKKESYLIFKCTPLKCSVLTLLKNFVGSDRKTEEGKKAE